MRTGEAVIAVQKCCTSLDQEMEPGCDLCDHRHYSLAAVVVGLQLLGQLPPEQSLQLMTGVADLRQFAGVVGLGVGLQESSVEGVAHLACVVVALAPVVDASMSSCLGDHQTHPSYWSLLVLWETVTPSCDPWSLEEVSLTFPD